jgi:hypothetical protein
VAQGVGLKFKSKKKKKKERVLQYCLQNRWMELMNIILRESKPAWEKHISHVLFPRPKLYTKGTDWYGNQWETEGESRSWTFVLKYVTHMNTE